MAEAAPVFEAVRMGRRPSWRAAAVVVAGLLLPVVVGGANGGYFPPAWGWISLFALWAAAIALFSGAAVTWMHGTFVGALALFAAWSGVSAFWGHATPAVTGFERNLMYAAAAAFVVVVVRDKSTLALAAFTGGVGLMDLYSLGTRLAPDRWGSYNPVAVYRLAAPVGYWNALGIINVLAILLALGWALDAAAWVRGVAGASLVVFGTTLYFTYSRGSLLALGAALVVLLIVDQHRIRRVPGTVVAVAVPLLAILLASERPALNRQRESLRAVVHEGHRLILILVALAVLAGVVCAAYAALEEAVLRRPGLARSVGAAVVVACAIAVIVGVAIAGNPAHVARRGWDHFVAPPPKSVTALNTRYFTFSNNGRIALWHVAWREFRGHPIVGAGQGSFLRTWELRRTIAAQVKNAHSLYLETLGDLGIVGLVLLALGLVTPLLAGLRRRRERYVPFALAAYVALLLHASFDWDWQIPVVVIGGFLCAGLLLGGVGATTAARRSPIRVGSLVLDRGRSGHRARRACRQRSRRHARRPTRRTENGRPRSPLPGTAETWAWWSTDPIRLLGEAQVGTGNVRCCTGDVRCERSRRTRATGISGSTSRGRRTARRSGRRSRARLRLDPLGPEIAEFEAGDRRPSRRSRSCPNDLQISENRSTLSQMLRRDPARQPRAADPARLRLRRLPRRRRRGRRGHHLGHLRARASVQEELRFSRRGEPVGMADRDRPPRARRALRRRADRRR